MLSAKRIVLASLLSLLCCDVVAAAPSQVQFVGGTGTVGDCSATPSTVTCATPTATFTAGNALFVLVQLYNNSGALPTFTAADLAGNTFTCRGSDSPASLGNYNYESCSATNIGGSLTNDVVTITFTSGSLYYPIIAVQEWSGMASSNLIDATNNGTARGTSVTSGNLTTTTNNEAVVCGAGSNTAGQAWSVGVIDGLTPTSRAPASSKGFVEDRVVTAPFTGTGSANYNTSAAITITCWALQGATVPPTVLMLEAGSDGLFDLGDCITWALYTCSGGALPISDSGTVHTGPRSILLQGSAGSASIIQWAGAATAGRISAWVNMSSLTATTQFFVLGDNTTFDTIVTLALDATSHIKLTSSGSKTSTATVTSGWHRFVISYVVTATTHFTINVFLDGTNVLSATNADFTMNSGTISSFWWTCGTNGTTISVDDLYADNGTTLDDPGDVRVTAKRPASLSTNNFNTVIGSCPNRWNCVNERPDSTTNELQQGAFAPAGIEESFGIEALSAGDVDISTKTIVGHATWALAGVGNQTGGGLVTSATNASAGTSGTTLAVTLAGTVGNFVECVLADQVGGSAPTIADASGGANSYTLLNGSTNTVRKTSWWAHLAASPGTITTTFGSSTASRALACGVFGVPNGFAGADADVNPADANDSTSPYDAPLSGTLAQATELVNGSFALAGPLTDTVAAGASETGVIVAASNNGQQAVPTNGTGDCEANSASSVSTLSCSISANVNDLLVAVGSDQIGSGTFVFSDATGGNIWSALTTGTSTVRCTAAYTRVASALSSQNVTATFTANTGKKAIVVRRFTGAQATPLDKNPAMLADSTSPYTSNATGTLSQANELLATYLCLAGPSTDTIAASTNVTDVIKSGTTGGSAGSNATAVLGQLFVSATTTLAGNITDSTSSRTGIVGMASFKTSGATLASDSTAALSYRAVTATTSVAPEITDTTANRTGATGTASFKISSGSTAPKLVDGGSTSTPTIAAKSYVVSYGTGSAVPSKVGLQSGSPATTTLIETGAMFAYTPAVSRPKGLPLLGCCDQVESKVNPSWFQPVTPEPAKQPEQ